MNSLSTSMNLNAERHKPIFVARRVSLAHNSAMNLVQGALNERLAFHGGSEDEYIITTTAAHRLPRQVLVPIDDATPTEAKNLVFSRLDTEHEEQFEFIDGQAFSGPEAAREVRRGSPIGEYFLELEKETLRIVQAAFFNNQL